MAKGVVIGGLNSGGSNIKSIQRGTVTSLTTNSTTVTISEVNVANSIVIINSYSQAADTPAEFFVAAELIDSTTLKLDVGRGASKQVNWQVIEFNNVKSKQTGTAEITDSLPLNVQISSVNLSKSMLVASFLSNYTSTGSLIEGLSARLLNSTSIQLRTTYQNATVKWQVIEFK